jgi:hypothetical protein
MIDKEKIFSIKKYKQGEPSKDYKLLEEIDSKVEKLWKRIVNQ